MVCLTNISLCTLLTAPKNKRNSSKSDFKVQQRMTETKDTLVEIQ